MDLRKQANGEVFKDYLELREIFDNTFGDKSEAIEQLSIKCLVQKGNILVYEVLGIEVMIKFRMVYISKTKPMGEIDVLVSQNYGTFQAKEDFLDSIWFDFLGNVYTSPEEQYSQDNLKLDRDFARKLFHCLIAELKTLSPMAPRFS